MLKKLKDYKKIYLKNLNIEKNPKMQKQHD